jgi:hypothetical protein
MKPIYSITLFSISFLFFIGVFKYYSTHQKDMAKVLFRTSQNTHIINRSIDYANQRLVREFEYSKYGDAKNFKSFHEQIMAIQKGRRNLSNSLKNFRSELFNLENAFYTIDEDEIMAFNEATFIFPFNHKKKTKAIIQKNAATLHDSYLNLIKKAENTLNDTSLFNPANRQHLLALKRKNLAALDTFKHKMKVLESTKTIQKYCSKFDLLQLQLQLSLFKQHYFIFENTVISNFRNTKLNIRSSSIYQQKYALINYSEDRPTIGEDYELGVFLSNYVTNESIQMQVNGKQIPVKNGIGYYKSTKGKSFKVDISLINQMTSERDVFSQLFKR